jgi:F0F1-type ATP synthase delta subunit
MSALKAAASVANRKVDVEHGRLRLQELELQLEHRERTLDAVLSHEKHALSLKTDLMRELLKALVEQRVDAVRQGFLDTLAQYADQCRHYMAQQERYADAEIKSTDPLERANLRARLSEIDLQLTSIRADCSALYREMTKVILLIGGNMPPMSTEDQRALSLSSHR